MSSFFKDTVKGTATAVKDATDGAATITLGLGKTLEEILKDLADAPEHILHVYTRSHQTRHIKEVASIPFKGKDIDKMKLSDVRRLILSENILEPRLLWSAFCNQRGGKVLDATMFKAYLDVLNRKSSEVGDIAEDNADTYRVYLLSEEITDQEHVAGMLDRGVRASLDASSCSSKKLTDLPTPSQPKAAQAPTSFSHNIFLNPTTTFSIIHPADMSEKHWSVVLRNNSLLNAHQVFGSENKGKVVKRSMHTAFVLRPRGFSNYQISDSAASDSIAKEKQMLRIPRYYIEDDSYIEQFETTKAVSRAMAQSSLSQTSAEMAVSGGAFGFTANASASYSDDKSSSSSSSSSEDARVMTITYNFPRVVIEFDRHSLDLSDECKEDISAITSAEGIKSFKAKYGRFFATRIELGGRLHASEESKATSAEAKAEQARDQKAAAALSFSSPYVQASAKMSHGESSSSSSENSTRASSKSMCWEAKGGDTLQCNDPPAWAYTVGSFYNWRAVKQSNVLSLEDIISTLPGFQDVKAKWAAILMDQPPVPTHVEVGFSLQSIVPQGYLTVGPSTIKEPDETVEDIDTLEMTSRERISDYEIDVYEESSGTTTSMTLKRTKFAEYITHATANATPVSVGEGTSASAPTQTFYVMAETNKDQEEEEAAKQKLKYNNPYSIYSKSGGKKKWLLSSPILIGFVSQSLVMAGSLKQATAFKIIPGSFGDTSEFVKDGDMVKLVMLDPAGDEIGKANCIEGEDKSVLVGARYNSTLTTRQLFKITYK
ncbi:hypothetical protein BDV25DRAFT_138549 [Aspergillus avenaceus]|uniref:MACPF-like domain-containing protein n=1 Tax=Aspergillus avenaceus TaxID=36643 RepID=A0A5N6TZD3_ASPAV|nr:hypothetical protein BDV25DRAFT_138549 [Aspergillus avenaceus]